MTFPIFTNNLGLVHQPNSLNTSIVDTTGGGCQPTGYTVDLLGQVKQYGAPTGVTVDRMGCAWDSNNHMIGGIKKLW